MERLIRLISNTRKAGKWEVKHEQGLERIKKAHLRISDGGTKNIARGRVQWKLPGAWKMQLTSTITDQRATETSL